MNQIINLLKEKKVSLGSVESLTGGLFASKITSFEGVSSFFKGSIVSYATEVKETFVGVDSSLVKTYGVVSKEVAEDMCVKGAQRLNVEVCISFTGNAGPTALEGKEVGLVYIGLYYRGHVEVMKLNLQGNRNQIREQCVIEGLKMLQKKLGNIE